MNRKKVEKYLVETVGIDVSYSGFDVLVDAILLVSSNPTKYRQSGFTKDLQTDILNLTKYKDKTKIQIASWLMRTVKTATNNKYKNLTAKRFIFLAIIELGG